MMKNLIQEPRTDKNGVTKRMWVKPNTGLSSDASLIPAPQPVGSAQKESREHAALVYSLTVAIERIEREDAEADGEAPRISYDELSEKLEGYETRTLRVLERNMPANSDDEAFVADMMFGMHTEEKEIRRMMTFLGCLDEDPVPEEVRGITQALHSYEVFGEDAELSELTGERMEQARALCTVTQAIMLGLSSTQDLIAPYPSHSILDKELVQVILDHSDRSDAIIEFILDRGTTDAGLIRNYVENGTALADGVL